ncbi:metalloregulator ArsR/SmtB family transcription factor [Nocardia colli]|uniref:Metalloregulator ArsR/SmtB family transcription factor n=2 Tax=Nocardia colli TaxID=2545717 RepID=A0A5N0ED35_9NOCA|nr:metalloregulator ArsR/SmtB family transcription factor [Nocardia colli]
MRRTILERLAERPQAFGELAGALPISRPAVSQHLKVLKNAGLVLDQAVGTRRIYYLNPAGMGALRAQLDRFWGRALETYQQAVEQHSGEVMTHIQAEPVHQQVMVNAPLERAFAVFVERFDAIKPREHNLLSSPIAETVFEPRVGGHIYDRGEDGSECRWARVLAYDPPNRLVFSWDINARWEIETDPDKTSEVEVTFTAEGPDRTRVDLEHRNIERHGEGWEAVRSGVDNEAGWPLYLQRYLDVAAKEA